MGIVQRLWRMFGHKVSRITNAASYDPTASAYFTAVEGAGGSLDTTFKTAWNNYVTGAKADGFWTKYKFIHPNAGGTIGGAQINAVNPAVFNLGFVNSPTISTPLGVTFDGTTQYATTGFIPDTSFASDSNWQVGVFMMTVTVNSGRIIMGSNNATTKRLYIQPLVGTTPSVTGYNGGIIASGATTSANNQLIAGSRTTTTRLDSFLNGASDGNNLTSDTSIRTTVDIYYGARNNNGSPANYADGKFCLDFAAEGMTATDLANQYTRTATFLTAIGA